MQNSGRLIFVEDDSLLGAMTSKILSTEYKVEWAQTLAEAYTIIDSNRPPFEVAILDKHLPDGNTLSLLVTIKKEYPNCIILILTGDSDFSQIKDAIALGADDYLIKSENVILEILLRIPIAKLRRAGNSGACYLPKAKDELTPKAFEAYLHKCERQYLEVALDLCEEDYQETAKRIGIGRSTLFAKKGELGLRKLSNRGENANSKTI